MQQVRAKELIFVNLSRFNQSFISILRLQIIEMIPGDLKNIFGLKDEKDLNMANNIWKMLDDMANSDPEQYKKFIEKNMKQGFEDVKQKKQQKEKPFKVKVHPGFCINMVANLNEKPLEDSLNQKVLITKEPWNQVKKKFSPTIKIVFSVTHIDRIKLSKSRSSGKDIEKYSIKMLSDIQLFYYSLQGPLPDKQDANKIYFCMILNSRFYSDLLNEPAGKKSLMSLSISYLQERLSLDKNPLLKIYNPEEHRRLAFYNIDKYSIEIEERNYHFGDKYEPEEFLLQKDIDTKRVEQLQKQKAQKKAKQEKQIKSKPTQIKFREQKEQPALIPELKISEQPPPQKKKILIEVLKEEETENANEIAYEMKQTQLGYHFEFLLAGVTSINEVDLQMKVDSVRLRVKDKKQLLINLKRPIQEDAIKAKFKKKQGILTVQVPFK